VIVALELAQSRSIVLHKRGGPTLDCSKVSNSHRLDAVLKRARQFPAAQAGAHVGSGANEGLLTVV
jgi:hypothetical protein